MTETPGLGLKAAFQSWNLISKDFTISIAAVKFPTVRICSRGFQRRHARRLQMNRQEPPVLTIDLDSHSQTWARSFFLRPIGQRKDVERGAITPLAKLLLPGNCEPLNLIVGEGAYIPRGRSTRKNVENGILTAHLLKRNHFRLNCLIEDRADLTVPLVISGRRDGHDVMKYLKNIAWRQNRNVPGDLCIPAPFQFPPGRTCCSRLP